MTVHLVGAGPGDPDLLTVKAVKALRRADVVVFDRLVDPRVLDLAPPWAERINVGKTPGVVGPTQDDINAILIDRGRRFDSVVRIKGGDPFVFGRGGEEASALRAAGLEVEVVPGVTSAVSAPAAAGIPVTMRGVSSGFTVVTAHQDPSSDRFLDWDALARAGTTLVILMGAARTEQIADRLRAGGMADDTPVAAISAATTDQQQVQRTDLAGLRHLRVAAPATIVVGPVAEADVLAASELSAPGATASSIAAPELSAPNTTAPELSPSGTTAPNTTAPELSPSGTTAPNTTAPELSPSGTTAPELSAPGALTAQGVAP